FGDEIPGREIGRRVVDVEAQADGDARAVRPRGGLQPLAGADVKHLRADLIERQLRPRLRPRLRARETHENEYPRNAPKSRPRVPGFRSRGPFRGFRDHASSTP